MWTVWSPERAKATDCNSLCQSLAGRPKNQSCQAIPKVVAFRSRENCAFTVFAENPSGGSVTIDLATENDRREIYRRRHQVYATELRQHQENDECSLSDSLDAHNTYLKASVDGQLAGFISVTPPDSPSYSVDKYFKREKFDFPFDRGLYEVRLLTVLPGHRRRACASLLMYAAFRWVQSLGGTRIVAIGRQDLLDLYRKAGLRPLGERVQSGAVTYELLSTTLADLARSAEQHSGLLR